MNITRWIARRSGSGSLRRLGRRRGAVVSSAISAVRDMAIRPIVGGYGIGYPVVENDNGAIPTLAAIATNTASVWAFVMIGGPGKSFMRPSSARSVDIGNMGRGAVWRYAGPVDVSDTGMCSHGRQSTQSNIVSQPIRKAGTVAATPTVRESPAAQTPFIPMTTDDSG